MRLDKYLKVSRIIKRRTVANEACGDDLVSVNGKTVKPSYDVKIGDVIEVRYGTKSATFRVLSVNENAKKAEAAEMYEVLS
ncbi:MAG: RNA-binding S4 domain-containing protein [Clostridiales bacterium]|nr:RNA-binding S4 domain-containing protein [Candidatus Coliplasma equi]